VKHLLGLGIVAVVLFTAAFACNMSTANLSSMKTSAQKDGPETTSFKAGDTIYADTTISNNGGKVTVKTFITVDDAPGMKKGDVIPNSETSLNVDGDAISKYSYPTFATTKGGKFNVVAEMYNDAGEKKDSKTVAITVAPGAAPSTTTDDKKADAEAEDK